MTKYVAVDLETTALDVNYAEPLEIAAVVINPARAAAELSDVMTELCFVPNHPRSVINDADDVAMTVNRWFERRLYDHMLSPHDTIEHAEMLADMLEGAILVGANPAYDAAVLWRWLRRRMPHLHRAPWHFRLFDVEATTMIAMGADQPLSLRTCCEQWTVENTAPHTALGDARATAAVFRELRKWSIGGRALDDEPKNLLGEPVSV